MSLITLMLNASALLVASLSQADTNGASVWGTLNAPTLPAYLGDTSAKGYPWSPYGPTDPTDIVTPNTGVTRYYDFTVTQGTMAPDGVKKSVLLVNGQFPGPLVQANWGDTIQVTVRNKLLSLAEGTSIHWHGMLQKTTPWADGVPGVTQCPIAPGSTFTYKFKADQYGTSWYHSHYSSQYSDGLFGPMVIYGPKNMDYDVDIGPVMLTDWAHADNHNVIQHDLTRPPTPLPVDSNLINGKMNFDCSLVSRNTTCTPNAGISKFLFQTGKIHRLRLINTGSEGLQRFTIDNHTMTVIAVDFVPVVPYKTNMVTLAVGQRTDVLVKGTGQPGQAYWMRSDYSIPCSFGTIIQPNALAAIYYPRANQALRPNSTATPYSEAGCINDALTTTQPFSPMTPPSTPSTTETFQLNLIQNATGFFVFTLAGVSFRANYNLPTLGIAAANARSVTPSTVRPAPHIPYNPEWNVHSFGTNTSIRLLVTNPLSLGHPMHLHGHNFWILAEGTGKWDGKITNPKNPMRRDTFIVDAGTPDVPGFTVIEWAANNPGVWSFHCHLASHVSLGLYANILERPDRITDPQIPYIMNQTCVAWDAWTASNIPDEIDSGV